MNGMRILGVLCASILASSLGTLTACGTADQSKEPSTAQAVSAASVSITLLDANGTRVGEASGVLVAPRLVLTAGHAIAGNYKWVVTSADGKQKVNGSRGMTYDWRRYDSNKAHPRRHDVGVIHLDEPIKLAAYPKLVADKSADGTLATRIRGTGAGFQTIDAKLGKLRSAPNSWLVDGTSETLDTGGAVYDSRGILGVVSGRGMTTGKFYIARLDGLVKWLAPKVACAGGMTNVRTYAPPAADKSKEICEDGGTGTSSSGGANGGSGGENGENGSCDGNTDGICSGGLCAGAGNDGSGNTAGTPGGSNPDGTNPDGTGGTPGTGGTGGVGTSSGSDGNAGTDGNTAGGTNGGTTSGGTNTGGTGGEGTSSGNDGNAGTDGNTAGGTNGGTTGGAGGGQTGAGSDGNGSDSPFEEACQGPSDNPELCPPEPADCSGPTCGGGQPDDAIDYGNCACGSSSSDSEIYLR